MITTLLILIIWLAMVVRSLQFIFKPATYIEYILRKFGNESKYSKYFKSPYAIIWLQIIGIIMLVGLTLGVYIDVRMPR